jgi:Outer membrane protein beta-barrel domain
MRAVGMPVAFRATLRAVAILALFLAAIALPARAQDFGDNTRWELGGHYAFLSLPSQCSGQTNCSPTSNGFGGNLSYNFSGWVSLDSEVNFFPDNGDAETYYTGGRVTEGLFGLRFGPTLRKWGFYSEVRPGFVTFSRVLNGGQISYYPGAATPQRRFGARLLNARSLLAAATAPASGPVGFDAATDFAFNYGEAIEYRPTKHMALRFDIGDTIVAYPEAAGSSPFHQHNFQISQALVIRF